MKKKIDPKDLMAVERSATALFGMAISLIVVGFAIEKFELFLYLMLLKNSKEAAKNIPQLAHILFYKYLGMGIIFLGIVLALYTYRYYIKWIKNLEEGKIDTDKSIYLAITLFVAGIGVVLLMSMIFM